MRKCISPFALALIAVVGCSENKSSGPDLASESRSRARSEFLLSTEPDGVVGVIDIRQSAKDQQEVVVVGRIGGSKDPWIEGLAAFEIADCSLVTCTQRSCENCPTPWDYCCTEPDKLKVSKVMVKFVGENEKIVGTGAKELLGVKELQTVVVKGKALCDNDGNLTSIITTGMFVRDK